MCLVFISICTCPYIDIERFFSFDIDCIDIPFLRITTSGSKMKLKFEIGFQIQVSFFLLQQCFSDKLNIKNNIREIHPPIKNYRGLHFSRIYLFETWVNVYLSFLRSNIVLFIIHIII